MDESKLKTEEQIEENVNKIKAELGDEIDLNKLNESIQDNQVEFIYDNVTYRAITPTHLQRQEAYQAKLKKHIIFLKDEAYETEENLKIIYKKRGIDIDGMFTQIKQIDKKSKDLMYNLGRGIKEGKPESNLEEYKKEIRKLNDESNTISMKRSELLELSIENQALMYLYNYLTYLIIEKKEEEKWVRAWVDYDAYLTSEQKLITLASYNASLVLNLQG